MKHRGSSKIKFEHHMIQGLRELMEKIEVWNEIVSIIPAQIKPTKAPRSKIKIKVQYQTISGLKCLAQSSGATQEVFIVSTNPEELQKKLGKL